MIRKYYPRVLAVLAVSVFFTNLDGYLFNGDITAVAPLYWVGGFVLLAVPLLFSKRALAFLGSAPLARWCYLYLLISCTWFLLQSSHDEAAWQQLRWRVLAVTLVLTTMVALADEDAQKWARVAVLIMTSFAIAVNFYELFNPETFSKVAGRSAGLYLNPNEAGVAITLGMILTLGLIPDRLRMTFGLLAGAGVAVTFSRATMTGWALVMFTAMWRKQINLRRSLVACFAIVVVGSLMLAWQWDNVFDRLKDANVLNDNVVGRLEWVTEPMAQDESARARVEVAAVAFNMFADNPIVGNGVGSSAKLLMVEGGVQISSHNQYLNLMVEHGILGSVLLPLLILAVVVQSRGEGKQTAFSLAIFFLFMGLFSHNLLDQQFTLLMLSLMAATNYASKLGASGASQASHIRVSAISRPLSSALEFR